MRLPLTANKSSARPGTSSKSNSLLIKSLGKKSSLSLRLKQEEKVTLSMGGSLRVYDTVTPTLRLARVQTR